MGLFPKGTARGLALPKLFQEVGTGGTRGGFPSGLGGRLPAARSVDASEAVLVFLLLAAFSKEAGGQDHALP